jgi:uncharacterized membrane protein
MPVIQQLTSLEGFSFVLRWLHLFFGVMWIGHLYYFNFTQGSAMAQADAPTKSGVTTKLLPIALYWFRWGAMWTMVSGVILLAIKGHQAQSMDVYTSAWGVTILIGVAMGLIMWFNVWFLIWPKQQIVMASANKVAAGGAADPLAAQLAPKALLASRTNTLLSVPMLYFMLAAGHHPLPIQPETNLGLVFGAMAIVLIAIEANAVKGKLGPMQTVKGVITSGFVLTAVVIAILAVVI